MEKKQCNSIVAVLVVTTAALAAMGCWFCWHCPSRIYPPDAHDLFWRQLAWNGVGFAVFVAAWLTGWKWLLKAAPWLMAAWLVAIAAALVSRPIHGVHKWLPIGPLHVNVATCFVPVFALFAAWIHEKKWIRPWMEWAAVAAAALWAVWYVAGNGGRMERLAAFFNPENWMQNRAYMARQLTAALTASNWFGYAGKSLGFLPCPESDGMMSASALLFGRWFPSAVMALFCVSGAAMSVLWKGTSGASKRWFVLLYALWLIVPPAYCLMHSLSFLPVAGMSPALVGYGGTAVVMAWFGTGVLAAMAQDGMRDGGTAFGMGVGYKKTLCICGLWMALAALTICVLALRCLHMQVENLKFAEPRPSDMVFGEFGLTAKRGQILAANGTPLAYSERFWRLHLDPMVVQNYDPPWPHCPFPYLDVAEALGIPEKELLAAYKREDSRYIFLKDMVDGSPAAVYFEKNRHWLADIGGIIREPVQRRVYPLGSAAVQVVGFMIGGTHTDTPAGAGGLEAACNKALAGSNGVYDKKLPEKERYKKAIPKRGADVHTTLVPTLQKSVAEVLAAACATNGAESAWGLVMKIPSGEIEAMASWPTFDPSMRRNLDKWNPSMAVNRAAQFLFEPGGLVKPLTYAIALDEGVLAEDAKIDQENGAWEYNGVTLKDEATNMLSIAEAIASRANIAAGKTACLIGAEKFHAALRRFGFGSKTGVVGIPGEEVGIIAGKPERWDKTTAMRVGMGYGFAATGLQIAQAYATLANHGTLVRPVLIAGEASSCATNGAMQIVSPAAADAIVRMLKTPMPSTVQMSEHDKESGCPVYSPTNYIASCAGYYPADRPQHVIVVSFVKPRTAYTGDEVARPVLDAITDAL